MSARITPFLICAIPVVAALLSVSAVALSGFSQRSPLPEAVDTLFYGFFLDRYPLFAFAVVYGLAHIVTQAAIPGPASVARRVIVSLAGIALLLAISLYPTFGGLVLRAGFGTGGLAFLARQPMMLAYAIGSAVAAMLFGGVIGVAVFLGNRRFRPRGGWRRGLASGAVTVFSGYLALWFAAALIGLGRDEGIGPWPRRAFTLAEALAAAGLILVAALPHALVGAFRSLRREAA